MSFSDGIFIFVYLPFFLLFFALISFLSAKVGWIRKLRLSDIYLILASLGFYLWASLDLAKFLAVFLVLLYVLGLLLAKMRGKSSARILLIGAVALPVLYLIYTKYTPAYSFIPEKLRAVFVPLGISFITFSAISYLVDIYRGEERGSVIDLLLYILFFPKLISGPIVAYKEFRKKARDRAISTEGIFRGIVLFIIGFAKKVMIADYFGSVILDIGNKCGENYDTGTAWLIAILYMLQIYFDFSGYSDIAVGLSRIMGIEIRPNFRFPYLSTSISEFWRRWHISLGAWFKEYLYIPLGGNRKGKARTLVNLFIVMLISGIWHGAGLGYLCWGAAHGICCVIEKASADKKWYKAIPAPVKWAVTMLIVMLGWEVFRLNNLRAVIDFLPHLLGASSGAAPVFTFSFFFSGKLIFFLIVAVFFATIPGFFAEKKAWKDFTGKTWVTLTGCILLLLLFAAGIIFVVNSTYSPFIYFQY